MPTKVASVRESWFQEGVRAEQKRIRGILRKLARECDGIGASGYAWAASAYRNASREIGRGRKLRSEEGKER